jgi:hypothetical protein
VRHVNRCNKALRCEDLQSAFSLFSTTTECNPLPDQIAARQANRAYIATRIKLTAEIEAGAFWLGEIGAFRAMSTENCAWEAS